MTVEHQQSHGLSFLTDALDPAHMVIPDDMGDDERMMMGALTSSSRCSIRSRTGTTS